MDPHELNLSLVYIVGSRTTRTAQRELRTYWIKKKKKVKETTTETQLGFILASSEILFCIKAKGFACTEAQTRYTHPGCNPTTWSYAVVGAMALSLFPQLTFLSRSSQSLREHCCLRSPSQTRLFIVVNH